jgi:hypothetical protein
MKNFLTAFFGLFLLLLVIALACRAVGDSATFGSIAEDGKQLGRTLILSEPLDAP